ncbi:unnamed protein product [Sphagnum jensenii]|uniref:JmjC domain-containing protein n=1 Tax=Sphagnum jensenii TaxID=128206 RepID=A0ABP0VCF2_9BRYO
MDNLMILTNVNRYDLITNFGFLTVWSIGGGTRDGIMKIFYFILAKTGGLNALNYLHEYLSNRLIEQFKATGYERKGEIPIPEFDWINKSPQEFYETFATIKHPVVLRGFMNGSALLTEFSWANILKNFSDERVFLTSEQQDGYDGLLKEVNDPGTYLHNSERIFMKYPKIRKYFEYHKLDDYLRMKIGYEQLFAGREGTGTPFHHAAVHNWFYMIDGTKKWWFVDPYDTVLGYPIAYFGRAAAALQVLFPYEGNLEDYPLFKYCPIYSTELNPGDVMYNPPMWWHAIKNTSPYTVAVASRWHTNGIAGHDYMMTEEDYDIERYSSMSFMMGPSSIPFLHKILQTPSPRFDDHATLREKNNRFVSQQRNVNKNGGVVFSGVKNKF